MIRILSRNKASQAVQANPKYPIVAIGESNGCDVDEKITCIAENCLCLKFDDIEFPRAGSKVVTEAQIKQAIEWAKNKDDIIVACRAGISRSSAMAYLIACSKVGAEEAIKILDMAVHQPNPLVIEVGSKILGEEVKKVFTKWKRELLTKLVQGLY